MLTVTPRLSQALVDTARRLGLAELDRSPSQERVDLEEQDALWEELCQKSSDPLIGVQLALNLQVGHLDIAGLLLMSCETLGESIELLVEYLPLIGQGGEARLLQTKQSCELVYAPHYESRRAERVEMALVCMLHLARWSTAGHFQARALSFAHQALDDPQRYPGLLGCPVAFASDRNALIFDSAELERELIQANPALRDQLRALADQGLQQLGQASLSRQVADVLQQTPRAGKDQVAQTLNMSGRHLTRCLAEEGFSFKQLRDRELEKRAREALARNEKISSIALELGFSDESAFAKAFRRWTGLPPSACRPDARP